MPGGLASVWSGLGLTAVAIWLGLVSWSLALRLASLGCPVVTLRPSLFALGPWPRLGLGFAAICFALLRFASVWLGSTLVRSWPDSGALLCQCSALYNLACFVLGFGVAEKFFMSVYLLFY